MLLKNNANFKKEFAAAFFIFLAAIVLSLIDFSSSGIKPNIFIITPIVISFLVDDWGLFLLFLIAEEFWLKFTPFLIWEYAILFILGIISFVITNFFIFKKILAVRISMVFLIQSVFWLSLVSLNHVDYLVFFMEFIYNIIVEELLFAFGLWIKKKYF